MWKVCGLALLAAVLLGWGVGSLDWCGAWPAKAPVRLGSGFARAPLQAGAAEVALHPPFPSVLAGYGPVRSEVAGAAVPLRARALVLREGKLTVAIANADVLLLPADVVRRVRARVRKLGLDALWLVATHAHSSFGGYDARLVAEVAGTGRFHAADRKALVEGLSSAVAEAARALRPVRLDVGEGSAPGLVTSRDGPQPVDTRLTRAVLTSDEGPLAQVVIYSAHPTLAGRHPALADPDWPGRLARTEERAGKGITLVLPGAVGDATAAWPAKLPRTLPAWVKAFDSRVEAVGSGQAPSPALGFSTVAFFPPRPDARRIFPWGFRRLGANLLCTSAPRRAEVSLLRIGPLKLLAVPGEPTFAVARALEKASGATRTVGLTNGYLGYVDTPARVRRDSGEAKRQYFGPKLAAELAAAAQLAGRALVHAHAR